MNLIVTCPRHFETEASDEISAILEEMGEESPKIEKSSLSGILMIDAKVDPIQVSHKIREKIQDEPWEIRYILRTIPIQKWILTDLDKILLESQELSKKIQEEQKYRITIEKRNSEISSQEIITKVADNVKRNVSLDNPDWIILIEIFGKYTGISLIEKDDILSVEKEKRAISE